MDNFNVLREKLEEFIRRFYLNELLKGGILFVSAGLLYFLVTLSLEHFLWLEPTGRQILFWSFVLVEVLLFLKFIVIPLLKLFKISKGIDYAQASRIIGNHFPEVQDKLLNLLQLKKDSRQSDLLLAGIDQKAQELRPVPFSMAVDFRSSLPYLKYTVIPILILGIIFISGNSNLFAESYDRVVHYKKAYVPPAPFAFQVVDNELKSRAKEAFKLQVETVGNVMPENPVVHYDGQTYFLNAISPGLFEYTFEPLEEDVEFYLSANEVRSGRYTIEVMEVPELKDFEMHLQFPDHTEMKDEIRKGSGNVTVPEGTHIEWRLKAAATTEISFKLSDTTETFQREEKVFQLQKRVLEDLNYSISTSNEEVKDFENLSYAVRVVEDEFPKLELQQENDSINTDVQYFFGKVSDDYGISGARLVYYPVENAEAKIRHNIPVARAAYAEFISAFPDTFDLAKGTSYEFYFEIFDNDALNNYKSAKSRTFSYRKKTDSELKDERLEQQNNAIQGLDNSLGKMEFSEKELEELSRLEKQKQSLDYNDRKKLKNFIDRQKKQNEIMKEYSEKLKKSLEEEESGQSDELKEQLEERLENKEKRLEENEKLLEELRKYGEKINEEELGEKLERLSKNNQNQEKSLEQLLELTKRYYVEQKASKISRDLENLAEEQEDLSQNEKENTPEAQDSLNEKFEEIRGDIEELEKENEALQEPMETGGDKEAEEEIQSEQKKASENLKDQKKKEAGENQKKAAEKMKEMSRTIQQKMQQQTGEQMQEDSEMLRKILDNLVTFSFEQEDLLEEFRELGQDNPVFASKLRRQNILKEHFQHVDDSLYALALRNPMISETITEKLADVEFNIEKSLERLAENQIPQGLASQQYVVTGANDLANLLSDILGTMQDMMSSSGSGGGGREMQLPDIIQKQEEIRKQMEEGLQKKQEGEGEQQGKGNSESEVGGEEENGELFRIFQEQQKLRKQLQEQLGKIGRSGDGEDLRKEMEELEEELLREGFNENTLRRMQNLEHKLLELEDADLEQGRKPEREANTNTEEFENSSKEQIIRAKEYFNSTEILNRQVLPLRQIYKQKVKEYFERSDH